MPNFTTIRCGEFRDCRETARGPITTCNHTPLNRPSVHRLVEAPTRSSRRDSGDNLYPKWADKAPPPVRLRIRSHEQDSPGWGDIYGPNHPRINIPSSPPRRYRKPNQRRDNQGRGCKLQEERTTAIQNAQLHNNSLWRIQGL